jgi:putative SOS response-associated peptidase YedK
MCGRYALSQSPSAYADWFGAASILTEELAPSFNVAPTDPVYAVAEHHDERQLGTFRWGLIPWFAKDRKGAARNINARVETVATKPTFKYSFANRRCLIPADGFYEWKPMGEGKGKLPHYIYATDGGPLAFAGLWASWWDPESDDRVTTCTILTGEPSPLVAPIHNRMPVLLDRALWDDWLGESEDVDELVRLLEQRPAVELALHPVSTLVNSVQNNLPELIEPLR